MTEPLRSRSNPRVQRWRSLVRDAGQRRREGVVIIRGIIMKGKAYLPKVAGAVYPVHVPLRHPDKRRQRPEHDEEDENDYQ